MKTERLYLREWREEDFEPFSQLNSDPRVMEFFPSLKTPAESDQMIYGFQKHLQKYGWGFWAVALLKTEEFIGFIGIEHVPFTAHFTPAVEIGWRLAYDYWGKGYATEGAKASLQYGFETLLLPEIISMTAVPNLRSQKVMKKIGMHRDPKDDFDHPNLPQDHWLQRHVLYRLTRQDWGTNFVARK